MNTKDIEMIKNLYYNIVIFNYIYRKTDLTKCIFC